MADVSYDKWEIYYTTDDDGIWITDGTARVFLGHGATVRDAIAAAAAGTERKRVTALWREAAAALEPDNDLLRQAREKIARAREQGGPLLEAIVRGHGCCMIHDPDFDQTLWEEAFRAALGVEGEHPEDLVGGASAAPDGDKEGVMATAWKADDENLTAAQRIQWLAENPDICEIIVNASEARSLWEDRVFAANRILELERRVRDLTEPRQATAESGPRFKDALAPITEMLRAPSGGVVGEPQPDQQRARAALGVEGEPTSDECPKCGMPGHLCLHGVEGEQECPACENGYICRHGDGCLLDEIAAEQK